MLRIAEYSEKCNELTRKTKDLLSSAGFESETLEQESNKIKIVFAGQYSAGKSSILKALTGNKDIAIGPDITTQQIHTYDWNNIEVIDTPGIHTQLRPDHDEISYAAIASADMLVFVITNELFDSYMADHFRKLAIDKDKAGEMILVVNKMDRTSDGNIESQQKIIREDLRRMVEPYTPEQLKLSFLDVESYLDSIEEREKDPELADKLAERSGFSKFIDTLNCFVDEKSISSKLTTNLYIIDNLLEKRIKELQPKATDMDIDGLEENFKQQRHLLVEARGRMQQVVNDIYTTAASQIRDIGLDASNLLVEGCKQEDVEAELEKYLDKAEDIIERCQSEASIVLETHLSEIKQELNHIENSEFSRLLKIRLEGKYNDLPAGIRKILANAGSGFQKAGHNILNNAYKAGSNGGLQLTNFSGGKIHSMVLNVGHNFNYKFKPWQAVKIAKGVAIAGEVLSALGIGVSVFMQIKEDQDEEKNRELLRTNRQKIRGQFNSIANELRDSGKKVIKENIRIPLEKTISEIDKNIQEIRDTRSTRSETCRQLEVLQRECRYLIQEIHSGI